MLFAPFSSVKIISIRIKKEQKKRKKLKKRFLVSFSSKNTLFAIEKISEKGACANYVTLRKGGQSISSFFLSQGGQKLVFNAKIHCKIAGGSMTFSPKIRCKST